MIQTWQDSLAKIDAKNTSISEFKKELQKLKHQSKDSRELIEIKSSLAIFKAKKESRLRGVNLNQKLDSIQVDLCRPNKHTSVQREAFAKCLSFSDCAAFMSIKKMFEYSEKSQIVAIGCVNVCISDILEDFGVEYTGNREKLVWRIHDTFGHLSLADLMKLNSMIADGNYKNQYQMVSSRQITLEYFMDWIGQYDADRCQALREIDMEFGKLSGDLDKGNLQSEILGAKNVDELKTKLAIREQKLNELRLEKQRDLEMMPLNKLYFYMNRTCLEDAEYVLNKLDILVNRWISQFNLVKKEQIYKDNGFSDFCNLGNFLAFNVNHLTNLLIEKMDLSPQSLISEHLNMIAKLNHFKTPGELFNFLGLDHECNDNDFFGWFSKFAARFTNELKVNFKDYETGCMHTNSAPLTFNQFCSIEIRSFFDSEADWYDLKEFWDNIK